MGIGQTTNAFSSFKSFNDKVKKNRKRGKNCSVSWAYVWCLMQKYYQNERKSLIRSFVFHFVLMDSFRSNKNKYWLNETK